MDCASYVFPAVRGTQAQREYYISMVPLDVMSKIFQFADEDLPPEIRAQRILNKSRIPEIRDYILSNPDSYVFSALTVSVDGNMEFMPADETMLQVGTISISMTSRFLRPCAVLFRTDACFAEYRHQSVRSSLQSSQRLDLRRSSVSDSSRGPLSSLGMFRRKWTVLV